MHSLLVSDKGGRRSGIDRRGLLYTDYIPERRESEERRNGDDRRAGLDRKIGFGRKILNRLTGDRRKRFMVWS